MAREKGDRGGRGQRAGEPPAESGLLGLKALVVVTGAVLMSLEIVGSRLLAPHFGNSVFVWGSLIGVFLAALALGYWVGGLAADRSPTYGRIATLCVLVAGLVFLIPVIGHPLCARLAAAGLGEQSGPLVAATLLFLPPSFLLGMVSPFSVRLAARSVETIGRSAGSLYALSTLGSIAGTLLTTFVLVPMVGVAWILKGLALAMLVLPLVLVSGSRRINVAAAAMLLTLVGLAWPSSPSAAAAPGEKIVLDEDTPYHHIRVVDTQHGMLRELRFDRFTESAIGLRTPHRSYADYTNYFHLAFLLRPHLASALFIGAGGGIGPRTFHETDPSMAVTVVDVDQRVLDVARSHFFMPGEGEVHAVARDGRMFLLGSAGGYDAIVLDAFTIGGRIPFHLATREAFELCRQRLAPGGVFIMNINSSVEGPNAAIFHSIGRTLQQVFPHVQAFVEGWGESPVATETRNVLLVATEDGLAPDGASWRALAGRFEARSSVTQAEMTRMAGDLLEPMPDLASAPLLTDDHAPIETMKF